MKPLENSKVHNWEDDELITKELLQTIEDKLRISLTKTDLLTYYLIACLNAGEETPKENPFDPFMTSIGASPNLSEGIGQLKTYLVGDDDDAYSCPQGAPFYFITRTSSGGLWEPRGLMEIYMLPTGNKSQLDDLVFEANYHANSSKLNPENISFNSPSVQNRDLVAHCYLKPSADSKISQEIALSLSYSEETGLYTGSDISVSSTYSYTCSFDPKTWKFTVSIGRAANDQHFRDILGKEIVGVSVQPKDHSCILANFGSYYLNDAPYKRYIYYRGGSYESKITNGYSYTLAEN